jgi:hypothetical protein
VCADPRRRRPYKRLRPQSVRAAGMERNTIRKAIPGVEKRPLASMSSVCCERIRNELCRVLGKRRPGRRRPGRCHLTKLIRKAGNLSVQRVLLCTAGREKVMKDFSVLGINPHAIVGDISNPVFGNTALGVDGQFHHSVIVERGIGDFYDQ